MKVKQFPLALTLVLMTALTTPSTVADAGNEATVYFLVRHAEKAGDESDPPLSHAGQHRARQLADLLQDAAITAIYSSDYNRTRATASPLAAALGLEVKIYDPSGLQDFANELVKQKGRILVVGHSNTTPELSQRLGGDPGTDIDEEAEYDRLYLLTRQADGTVSTVLMRYGEVFNP